MVKIARIKKYSQKKYLGSIVFLIDGFASRVKKKTARVKLAKILWISLLCLSLIGFPLLSHALTVNDIPNPRQEYNGW
jgi:uncharacterized protein